MNIAPPWMHGYLYAMLNIGAIAFIYTAFYKRGIADGLDKRAWSVTVLMRFLFLIIGCKLFTISIEEFLSQTYATESLLSQRTLAGGIFLGLSIFSILFLYFRFPVKVFDYALVPVLAGLAIQKIGCFVAGCCYGMPFNGPWSVTYRSESLASLSHRSHHLIDPAAEHALSLHPVQLYEAVGYALCAYFVYHNRARFRKPGSLFLLSSAFILTTRLVTNFFRDPSSYTLLGKSAESLVRMQVTLLIILILSITLLYFYERSISKSVTPKQDSPPRPSWPLLLSAGLIILVTLRWYNAYELLFLLIAFIISLNHHWQAIPILVQIRSTLLLIPMIVLMAQTTPVKKDSLVDKYNNVRVGFSTGKFVNSMSFEDGDGCGSKARYFNQTQTMVGAGYGTSKTFQRTNTKGRLYLSTNETFYYTFFGSQSETWADDLTKKTDFFVAGGGAQFRQQNNWVGIGVGLNVGNLRMAYQNKVKSGNSTLLPEKGYWNTPVLPSGYLRIGPRPILFAEYSYAQFVPSMSPGFYSTLMVGTGFGLKDTELKFGTMTGIEGMLLALRFPVGKKWGFESYYHFGNSYNGQETKQNQISFALEYKIKR